MLTHFLEILSNQLGFYHVPNALLLINTFAQILQVPLIVVVTARILRKVRGKMVKITQEIKVLMVPMALKEE